MSLELQLNPEFAMGGSVKTVIGISRDVSLCKKAEVEKKKLESRLQQVQKMEAIGTLAGGIAHDFNNILFPIVGFAEMLQEDLPQNSPEQESITEVLQAALRARDLVKQILTFSRRSDQELKPVKFQSILKEALKLLGSSLPATIVIQTDIDPNCGVIVADPTQLHQIIMNLATNAYHSMQDSGGKLKVSLKQIEIEFQPGGFVELIPGKYALLKVIDTGPGIKKDIIDKIFDPYFSTKEKGKGTGLGLSIVQGIVKSYNGNIYIYSEPGKGTEVNVYLPIMKKTSNDERSDPLQLICGGTERILLVDDEKAIIKMEQKVLERLGYQVISETESPKALGVFKANPDNFDLIITDMTMPEMTGLKLATEIKAVRADIPVIICTGFSDQINEESSAQLGIQGYVTKPVIIREIAQVIRDVLDGSNRINPKK
ncbi:MAG: response regulator [Desulfobacteraceae bacterium]|nr:response regulator [Desulfobacteraceae bacterium]